MKPNFTQKVSNWGNFPEVEKEIKSEDSLLKIKGICKEQQRNYRTWKRQMLR